MSVFGISESVTLPERRVMPLLSALIIIFLLVISPSPLSAERAGPAKDPGPVPVTKDVKPPTFTPGYEKGEIVVKYSVSVDNAAIKAVNLRMNVKIKRKLPLERSIYLLALPKGMKVLDAIGEFRKIKEVEYARPNYTYRKKRGRRAR